MRNWLLLTMGKVGSGKSLSNMTLALALDPTFNIDRVVFTKSEFMELVRADLTPGSFIVAEEIGTWFSNREFLSQGNIGLSKIIQTFRHQRLGVIFNLPHLRMMDKNLRTMGDASLEMVEIDRLHQVAIGKYKIVATNPRTGKEYEHFPKVYDEGRLKGYITKVKIHRPPAALEKMYLEKKKEHMEKFNAMVHHGFMRDDGEEDDDRKTKRHSKKYKYHCDNCDKTGYTDSSYTKSCFRCHEKIELEENE